MSAETLTYQCPACGGTLRFNGAAGKLTCDFCGSSFEAAEIEAIYAAKQHQADAKAVAETKQAEAGTRSAFDQMGDVNGASSALTEETLDQAVEEGREAGDPIAAYLKRASWNEAERAGMRSFTCSSCGAVLTCDAATAVSECPYCGNAAVIPGTLSDDARPDWVIPFKLDKEQAKASLTEYYKGKKFLPKEFVDQNAIEHIQGVYVPFWFYDGTADGAGRFEATRERTYREGKYQVIERDIYDVWREGSVSFKRIPVDGSAKMPDAHMDAIEPYDYSELQPFSPAYLPGYLTERYDEDPADCKPRAERRMTGSLSQELQDSVTGYHSVMQQDLDAECTIDHVGQSLLPVWMLHTSYENEDYLFAMNGQTGRFIGDLPVSKVKVVLWFLGIFLVACAALVGVDLGFIQFEDTTTRVLVDGGIPLAIAGFVCYKFYSDMKTARQQTAARQYITPEGLQLRRQSDQFVRTDVSRMLVDKDD